MNLSCSLISLQNEYAFYELVSLAQWLDSFWWNMHVHCDLCPKLCGSALIFVDLLQHKIKMSILQSATCLSSDVFVVAAIIARYASSVYHMCSHG